MSKGQNRMRFGKRKAGRTESRGFSLVELMVVLVIMGILGLVAVTSFNSPTRKLKNTAFMLRNDLNLAKSEAVNRAQDVYVKFVNGATKDGHLLWLDENADGDYTAGTDTLIKPSPAQGGMLMFPGEIQYYDTLVPGGPPVVGGNGIPFDGLGAADVFFMKANGTASESGSLVLITKGLKNPTIMRVVVTNTTGRIRIEYWDGAGWVNK